MSEQAPTILIIDDDPTARLTLESILVGADIQLSFAENGQSGIEQAKKLRPDAILLDVMMPGIDGYAVCRRLRADPWLSDTHIIMVTALDDRDARLTGFMAGADDFISKPFDGLELQLRLKTILRINRYRRLLADRTRFLWLVEHDDDGYLLLTPSGQIQYANASAQTYMHLPQRYEELIFTEHATQYYIPHPAETWQQWLDDPSPCYLVQTETTKARAFWLLLDAMDATFEQESSRVVRIRDVTENLSMQQDMRKFHSAITHKMRTPVSLLVSSMSLIEAKLNKLSMQEIKDFVQVAIRGVNRLSDQVRDVLNYIDSPLSLQKGILLNTSEIEATIKAMQEQTRLTRVEVHLKPGLPAQKLLITNYAMELILAELFENSVKFHPENNPKVEITISMDEEQRFLKVELQDNSATLTSEQLIWARRPYHQGEKSFTGEVPGMGLGIPLVTTLLWQIGGQFRISNRESGVGVLIVLHIPILEDSSWNPSHKS